MDVLAALDLGVSATDDEAFTLMDGIISHDVGSGEKVTEDRGATLCDPLATR